MQPPSLRSVAQTTIIRTLVCIPRGCKERELLLETLKTSKGTCLSEDILLLVTELYAKELTDELLCVLAPQHLRQLKLKGCTSLTCEGVAKTIKKCSNLTYIDFSGCENLLRPAIYCCLKDNAPHITHLSFEECEVMTDDGVQIILMCCPGLKHLNVSSCNNITDKAFAMSSSSPNKSSKPPLKLSQRALLGGKNLSSVDLSGCQSLTSAAVKNLVALCGPTLTSVNISWTDLGCIALLYLAGLSTQSAIQFVREVDASCLGALSSVTENEDDDDGGGGGGGNGGKLVKQENVKLSEECSQEVDKQQQKNNLENYVSTVTGKEDAEDGNGRDGSGKNNDGGTKLVAQEKLKLFEECSQDVDQFSCQGIDKQLQQNNNLEHFSGEAVTSAESSNKNKQGTINNIANKCKGVENKRMNDSSKKEENKKMGITDIGRTESFESDERCESLNIEENGYSLNVETENMEQGFEVSLPPASSQCKYGENEDQEDISMRFKEGGFEGIESKKENSENMENYITRQLANSEHDENSSPKKEGEIERTKMKKDNSREKKHIDVGQNLKNEYEEHVPPKKMEEIETTKLKEKNSDIENSVMSQNANDESQECSFPKRETRESDRTKLKGKNLENKSDNMDKAGMKTDSDLQKTPALMSLGFPTVGLPPPSTSGVNSREIPPSSLDMQALEEEWMLAWQGVGDEDSCSDNDELFDSIWDGVHQSAHVESVSSVFGDAISCLTSALVNLDSTDGSDDDDDFNGELSQLVSFPISHVASHDDDDGGGVQGCVDADNNSDDVVDGSNGAVGGDNENKDDDGDDEDDDDDDDDDGGGGGGVQGCVDADNNGDDVVDGSNGAVGGDNENKDDDGDDEDDDDDDDDDDGGGGGGVQGCVDADNNGDDVVDGSNGAVGGDNENEDDDGDDDDDDDDDGDGGDGDNEDDVDGDGDDDDGGGGGGEDEDEDKDDSSKSKDIPKDSIGESITDDDNQAKAMPSDDADNLFSDILNLQEWRTEDTSSLLHGFNDALVSLTNAMCELMESDDDSDDGDDDGVVDGNDGDDDGVVDGFVVDDDDDGVDDNDDGGGDDDDDGGGGDGVDDGGDGDGVDDGDDGVDDNGVVDDDGDGHDENREEGPDSIGNGSVTVHGNTAPCDDGGATVVGNGVVVTTSDDDDDDKVVADSSAGTADDGNDEDTFKVGSLHPVTLEQINLVMLSQDDKETDSHILDDKSASVSIQTSSLENEEQDALQIRESNSSNSHGKITTSKSLSGICLGASEEENTKDKLCKSDITANEMDSQDTSDAQNDLNRGKESSKEWLENSQPPKDSFHNTKSESTSTLKDGCMTVPFIAEYSEKDNKPLVLTLTYKPRLRSLDITNINFQSRALGVACLKLFFSVNTTLDSFALSWSGLDDDTLIAMVSNQPGLRSLKLTDCEKLRDRSLISLPVHCPLLESVDLRGVAFVTDLGVVPMLDCPRLKTLSLAETSVTDVTMFALAEKCGDKLRDLDLSWCEGLTDKGRCTMAESCTGLKSFALRQCTASRITMETLSIYCQAMTSLDLSSVGELTDEVVVSMVTKLPNLTFVDLSWNPAVTSTGVSALLSHCGRLEEAVLSGLKALTTKPFLGIISDLPRWRTKQEVMLRRKLKSKMNGRPVETYIRPCDMETAKTLGEDLPFRSTTYSPVLRHLVLEYSDMVNDEHLSQIVAVCRGTLNIRDYYGQPIEPSWIFL